MLNAIFINEEISGKFLNQNPIIIIRLSGFFHPHKTNPSQNERGCYNVLEENCTFVPIKIFLFT